MHPVHVDGGDVLPREYGDVRAGGGAGRVAGEGGVGGREDGVVGYPFALHHPGGGILGGLVVEGGVSYEKRLVGYEGEGGCVPGVPGVADGVVQAAAVGGDLRG